MILVDNTQTEAKEERYSYTDDDDISHFFCGIESPNGRGVAYCGCTINYDEMETVDSYDEDDCAMCVEVLKGFEGTSGRCPRCLKYDCGIA